MYTEFLARLAGKRLAQAQPVILGLSLFALSACTTADVSSSAHQPAQCEDVSSKTNDLPADVLIGTDLAELTSFEVSNADIAGQYQAELGGAMVTVSITPDSLTRTFQEPGTDPDRRAFPSVCVSGSDLVGDGMVARRVSEGLLYLEPSSDVGGMPDDLWLLLEAQ